MKFCRKVILNATLLGSLLLPATVLPCFGQQEMDPTWYDPWATTRPAVTSASASSVEQHAVEKKTALRTSTRGKRRSRRPMNVAAHRTIAVK